MPEPKFGRPPEVTSTMAYDSATSIGLWRGKITMAMPRRIWVVRLATAARKMPGRKWCRHTRGNGARSPTPSGTPRDPAAPSARTSGDRTPALSHPVQGYTLAGSGRRTSSACFPGQACLDSRRVEHSRLRPTVQHARLMHPPKRSMLARGIRPLGGSPHAAVSALRSSRYPGSRSPGVMRHWSRELLALTAGAQPHWLRPLALCPAHRRPAASRVRRDAVRARVRQRSSSRLFNHTGRGTWLQCLLRTGGL